MNSSTFFIFLLVEMISMKLCKSERIKKYSFIQMNLVLSRYVKNADQRTICMDVHELLYFLQNVQNVSQIHIYFS